MQLLLSLPGLLALPTDRLLACRPLARFAAGGAPTPAVSLARAVLDTLAPVTAAAPLAALGAGEDAGPAWVIQADPVTLVPTHDDVELVGRVDDLDVGEMDALLGVLNAHFAGDGLGFFAPRPDVLFARSPRAHDLATTPLDAVRGRRLRDALPDGPDGRTWRRWSDEVQMLLHSHPLAARAVSPVTALWFADGGTLPQPGALPRTVALAAGGRAGDLARGLALCSGGAARTLPATLGDTLKGVGHPAWVVVALPALADPDGLPPIARDWIAPALAARDAGSIERLALCADGDGSAGTWIAPRLNAWRKLQVWLSPATLPLPARVHAR
jgi:hypothetical protein